MSSGKAVFSSWLSVATILLCCGVVATAEAASLTSIVVDGEGSDWVDRPVAGQNPEKVPWPGCHGFEDGYAFINDAALYFLIEMADNRGTCVQFDVGVQADDRKLLLSWIPGNNHADVGDVTSEFEYLGRTEFSAFAIGSTLEGRIDLRDLGSPNTASLLEIKAMAGTCCQFPAWLACHKWVAQGETAVVDEEDAWDRTAGTDVESARRAANPYGIPDEWQWEKLMTPPAADITGIDRSEDGTIFIQHSGLSPGISTLDPDTGRLDRILELPSDATIYRSIVAGPDDTAYIIIPAQDVVWQVSSDGAYAEWGSAPQAWPVAYTGEDYLLGRSHKGELVKMHTDGSIDIISDQFDDIDSVVAIGNRVFVSDPETGSIVRIDADGTHRTLADKILLRDPMDMAADPSGNLYLNTVSTGLVRVDQENGGFTSIPNSKSPCTIHPADFVFSSSSTVLFADPTASQVSWLDLRTREMGVLVSNEGANAWAMDIGPDDAVYVGVSGCNQDPARVMRFAPGEEPEIYVSGVWGELLDMAFDNDGGLYIATHNPTTGQAPVHYVPSGSRSASLVPRVIGLFTITVDPTTNRAYGTAFEGELIREFTPQGLHREHAVSLPQPARDFNLGCAPDGTLFASCSGQKNAQTGPVVERWILRIDLAFRTASILAQNDWQGCCVLSTFSVASDGSLWWLLNPDFQLHVIRQGSSNTELFAERLPIDAARVAVDRHGAVYVTSPSGLLRFYPSAD